MKNFIIGLLIGLLFESFAYAAFKYIVLDGKEVHTHGLTFIFDKMSCNDKGCVPLFQLAHD